MRKFTSILVASVACHRIQRLIRGSLTGTDIPRYMAMFKWGYWDQYFGVCFEKYD